MAKIAGFSSKNGLSDTFLGVFPKNARNHPDFVPGKFGGPKPLERRSFWPQKAKNYCITPLWAGS